MKKSGNVASRIVTKILNLIEANEDETLRQEYRDRNNMLIEMYEKELKQYEIRN